jgi:monofunctional biosynthetic peptidoglycan transglycosylase
LKRPKRTKIRRVVRWAAVALLAFYALAGVALLYLRFFRPLTTMVQVQRRLETLIGGRPYSKHQEWRPLRAISADLQHAVIAAEDARFYQHFGIDWKEVQEVAEDGLEGNRLRGGSTLTQQLIKNLFFTTHRNPLRKAIEVMLTPAAELILGKQRILELYLNVIEWGPGVYGAEAAAGYHYRTSAARLTRDQAARLAACIPAPTRRRPAYMHGYSAVIQTRMRQMGW